MINNKPEDIKWYLQFAKMHEPGSLWPVARVDNHNGMTSIFQRVPRLTLTFEEFVESTCGYMSNTPIVRLFAAFWYWMRVIELGNLFSIVIPRSWAATRNTNSVRRDSVIGFWFPDVPTVGKKIQTPSIQNDGLSHNRGATEQQEHGCDSK